MAIPDPNIIASAGRIPLRPPRLCEKHTSFAAQRLPRRRAAALYATTLLICVAISAAGMGLVTLQMAHRRVERNVALAGQSALVTRAGLEWVFWGLANDPNWRTNGLSGQTYDLTGLGIGPLSFSLSDDDDNLSDDDTDLVTVVVQGRAAAQAMQSVPGVQKLRFTAAPAPSPALAFTLFSSGSIDFSGSAAVDAPVRAHGNITDDLSTALASGASFETVLGGVISPSLTPATYADSAISFPSPQLSYYTSQATLVFKTNGSFDVVNVNLTPTANSQGVPNAKGIYWIDAGGNKVKLNYVHVKGTLIITNTAGNDVQIDKACWFEPGGFGLPVLLVDTGSGDVDFEFPSGDKLDESSANLDFNGDGDKTDSINPAVSGLVWAAGDVSLGSTPWDFTGCLMAPSISVSDGVRIKATLSLANLLTPGFTDGKMHRVPGSCVELPLDP